MELADVDGIPLRAAIPSLIATPGAFEYDINSSTTIMFVET